MNRKFFTPLLLCFLLAACHTKTHTDKNPVPGSEAEVQSEQTIELADLAVNRDLICGMKLYEEGIADTALYEGKIYGFCATECKTEFLKNPQSYLEQQ